MKILSHRGYWINPAEKNTEVAFSRSFSLGFGTETDIRDSNGKLLISHDMPSGVEIACESFLDLAAEEAAKKKIQLTLALNIKADGLASSLKQQINKYPELDCFVFDMSVPDMRGYFEAGIPVFSRMSEVEQQPAWFDLAAGVWLDGFNGEWYDNSTIKELLEKGKRVCIVSPELHKRPHLVFWESIRLFSEESGLMLCTDFPEDAARFFQQ